MSRKLLRLFAVCVVSLVAGCAVVVTPPPQTTIRGENGLTSMSVDVNGATIPINGIDLAGVTIGDVFFRSIEYGHTTAAANTNMTGSVTVTIDTAYVSTTTPFGTTAWDAFPNIASMKTMITPETENTVVFDATTAGVIFSALAKKTAK